MNAIMKEITSIMGMNCEDCPVSKVIRLHHGMKKQDQYCVQMCLIGKKLQTLSKELEFGNNAEEGLKLTEDKYLLMKNRGFTDEQIYKKYAISRNTLTRRKKHWGIEYERPKKRIEELGKTKREYLNLKLQNFSDKQIAKFWAVGNNTLLKWKKENNLKGGIGHTYKLEKKTKQDYLNLKLQEKTDREIARLWGVAKGTLLEWKKREY
jgi:hypothetical protein